MKISIKDDPSDYNSQDGNLIDSEYLASNISWTSNSYYRILYVGGSSSLQSFVGYLGGVSFSCRNAGSNYIDKSYYALASLNEAEILGVWLLDKNTSDTLN